MTTLMMMNRPSSAWRHLANSSVTCVVEQQVRALTVVSDGQRLRVHDAPSRRSQPHLRRSRSGDTLRACRAFSAATGLRREISARIGLRRTGRRHGDVASPITEDDSAFDDEALRCWRRQIEASKSSDSDVINCSA